MSNPGTQESHDIDEIPLAPKQNLDPMMLNALLCPKTRGPLILDRESQELISKKAKLAYPIREGVPILLIEEARQIDMKA